MMKLPSPSREQPVPLFKCQVQETGSECWPSIQHGHRGVQRALAGDLPLLLVWAAVQRQLRPYATDEEWQEVARTGGGIASISREGKINAFSYWH